MHDLGEANPAAVHLTVQPNFRSRAAGVVLHRGFVDNADVRHFEGFKVTSPLRTLVDLARSHLDLDQLARAVRDASERDPGIEQALRARAKNLPAPAASRLDRALTMARAA